MKISIDLKNIYRYLAGIRRNLGLGLLIVSIIGILETTGFALLIPLLSGLSGGTNGGRLLEIISSVLPIQTLSDKWLLVGLLSVIFTARALLQVIHSWSSDTAIKTHTLEYCKKLSRRTFSCDWESFASMNFGGFSNLMHTQVNKAEHYIHSFYSDMAIATSVFIYLVALLVNSGFLAMVVLAVGALYFGISLWMRAKIREKAKTSVTNTTEYASKLQETLRAAKEFRITNTFESALTKVNMSLRKAKIGDRDIVVASKIVQIGVEYSAVLIVLGMCVLASTFFVETADSLLLSLALMLRAAQRVSHFQGMTMINVLGPISASLLNLQSELNDMPKRVRVVEKNMLDSEIRFVNVGFSYRSRPSDRPISNFNLAIPRNNVCAIVGPSGVGKSTLVELLLGLLHPREGKILIDDTDVLDLSSKSRSKIFSFVPQTVQLLNGTIAENIDFFSGKSDSEIALAADLAGALTFIEDLPEGFKTHLSSDYTALSGGQKQRIAIARALLQNPSILVLDEPTSALDAQSTQALLELLGRLKKNMTVIIITHDRSIKAFADQIVEMGSQSQMAG